MPTRKYKSCSWPGCGATIPYGDTYCEKHRYKKYKQQEAKPYIHQFQHLYNSARWRRERAEFLKRWPECDDCGAPATVVDHVKPHKGDERLFWDHNNWAPRCKRCHDRKTALYDSNLNKG